MEHKKKQLILTILVIVFGVATITASVFYLATGNMVPGLNPLLSTCLMVPLIIISLGKENGKLSAILFAIAGVLNLIAAVMQIWNAL